MKNTSQPPTYEEHLAWVARKKQEASAASTSKIAAPEGALSLTTGSLPVPPKQFLLKTIEDTKARIASYRREQKECHAAKLYAQSSWAEGYADSEEKNLFMLESLRDRLGFSTERQPEENKADGTK